MILWLRWKYNFGIRRHRPDDQQLKLLKISDLFYLDGEWEKHNFLLFTWINYSLCLADYNKLIQLLIHNLNKISLHLCLCLLSSIYLFFATMEPLKLSTEAETGPNFCLYPNKLVACLSRLQDFCKIKERREIAHALTKVQSTCDKIMRLKQVMTWHDMAWSCAAVGSVDCILC